MLLLDFEINGEWLSIDAGRVLAILPSYQPSEPRHKFPGYKTPVGCINYRGEEIPLFDMSRLMGYACSAVAFGSCYVLFDSPDTPLGRFALMFGKVSGVHESGESSADLKRVVTFDKLLKFLKSDG